MGKNPSPTERCFFQLFRLTLMSYRPIKGRLDLAVNLSYLTPPVNIQNFICFQKSNIQQLRPNDTHPHIFCCWLSFCTQNIPFNQGTSKVTYFHLRNLLQTPLFPSKLSNWKTDYSIFSNIKLGFIKDLLSQNRYRKH